MKVVVCGNRLWSDRLAIRREISKLPPHTIVIHGGNGYYDKNGKLISGADMMADEEARKLGFEVRSYPVTASDWAAQGRSAGPCRNRLVWSKEHPDADGIPVQFVLAFSKFFTKAFAPGTFDMCQLAVDRGVPVSKYSE